MPRRSHHTRDCFVQAVLDCKEMFNSIVELLKQSEDKQVRKEVTDCDHEDPASHDSLHSTVCALWLVQAAWCIGNACSGGTDVQMKFMIDKV